MASTQTEALGLEGTAFASSPGLLLARANAHSVAASNAALAEHGLRVRSYAVLAAAASGSRPSQRELAEFLRLDPSQVVALVDDLETRGLVRREALPSDRRTRTVVATPEGEALFVSASVSIDASHDRTLAGLSTPEITTLVELLSRVVAGHAPGSNSQST